MKNLLTFILLISFLSCTKDTSEPVPGCQAATYYLDTYDNNWKYQSTAVSIHWCKVCGEDLERFKTYDEVEQVCDEYKLMRLVIGKDSCLNK